MAVLVAVADLQDEKDSWRPQGTYGNNGPYGGDERRWPMIGVCDCVALECMIAMYRGVFLMTIEFLCFLQKP